MSQANKSGIKYPSARLKGLKDFMAFTQEPDWKPDQVDIALLRKLDIGKGREGETVYALNFLGIIDSKGIPTADFDELKRDYSETLKRLVREKYGELLKLLPLRMINQSKLVKFFGSPVETAEYQAKLFVWFCEQAEISIPNIESKFHRARFDKQKTENFSKS